MTKQEREMLKMTDSEFKEFQKTQPMINDMVVMKAADYVQWLENTKGMTISEATVRNKIKEGVIDSIPLQNFYAEKTGVTQRGKSKNKYPVYIIMNLATMSYEGYNDGKQGRQGKPITSVSEKRKLKKRLEETDRMLEERGSGIETK